MKTEYRVTAKIPGKEAHIHTVWASSPEAAAKVIRQMNGRKGPFAEILAIHVVRLEKIA